MEDMASIFRKVTTRPLPAGATVKNGVARWKPRGATRFIDARVTTQPDGRLTVAVPSAEWWCKYRAASGRVIFENTRCKDETNARLHLARAVHRDEQVKAGILSPAQAKAAGKAREGLASHFEAFVAQIRGKAGGVPSPVHLANTRRYLDKLAAAIGWRTLGDVTRGGLDAWIASQQRPGPDGKPIRSASSIGHHIEAVVAFVRWASDPVVGRLPSNPLGTIPKPNPAPDPRRTKRALAPGELVRLCQAAMSAPRHGRAKLDGPSRAFPYYFLIASGWRFGEARARRCRDVLLNATPPMIQVPALDVKARRVESVPIRSDLLPLLAARMEGKAPDDPVFFVPRDLVKRFDQDCKRAGIPKRDARGYTVDVHSLRTTLGTAFAANGVPISIAMRGLRHSTSKLIESMYVDQVLLPVAAALEATIDPELATLFAPGPASFAPNRGSFAPPALAAEDAPAPDGPRPRLRLHRGRLRLHRRLHRLGEIRGQT